jgi:hypothetical protein
MGTKVKLTASGMANIATSKTENDFSFLVGDTAYSCPWFVANFLSPRVAHLHSIDPSVDQFVIKTDDPDHQFKEILSFGRGLAVDVNETNRAFLASVASELGNYELYFALHEPFQTNLQVSTFCELFPPCDIGEALPEKAVEYLAEHFHDLESSFLNEFPISGLTQILSHPSLRLLSEDSLYEFLSSHFDSNPCYIGLLELVRFEFLTKSAITNFVKWTCDHFDQFTLSLSMWQAVTARLLLDVRVDAAQSERFATRFALDESSRLNGIIAHLTRKHGGNVHNQKIVTVAGSSQYQGYVAHNAVDLTTETYFESQNAPNQWLCYDFQDRRVQLTDYSIAAHKNNHWLRSWVIEGSQDNKTWVTLDERNTNTEADAGHPITSFAVQRRITSRYVRIRQTANSAYNANWLVLYGFEVFGLLMG